MKNKYNVGKRGALLALALTAALVLNASANAQAPPGSLWYNGDWNFLNGLSNERNTAVTQAAVYDDFNVPAGQIWNLAAVFSDNLLNTTVTGANWEIRTGVSEGNGGTLIASGSTNSPVVTPTGRSGFGFTEFMVEVREVNLFLPMLPSGQHYWLNVTPVGNGSGRSFNSTTSGVNCVGTPCGNDQNAFFNSTFFGTNFTSTANEGQPYDYSMGVVCGGEDCAPEPATVTLLAFGLGALVIALRRRRSLVRATLPVLLVAAGFALNTTAIAQAPPGSLWYNGDFNGQNGLANERNTKVTQAAAYDDFNITGGPMWNVTAVFSDNLASTVITGADWEIRTGISEGNAGTLIASGITNSPVVTPTGRSGFGYTEYMVEVTGLNIFLPMLPVGQFYWLNVTPVGNGTGRSFNSTTSGTNCVGTCDHDVNVFFNSTYYGVFFHNPCLEQCYDFSMGVIGGVVPEPATWALLTCGVGALLIALRRRSVAPRARVGIHHR